MGIIEAIATITGVIGVALQAKEKIIAWPLLIISVGLAVYVFWINKLYSDMGLHCVYVVLNVYGWMIWSGNSPDIKVEVTKVLSKREMLGALVVGLLGSVILGYVMDNYTDADLAYFDAFTTSMSLVAQFLLAKKILQNWILWIIADLVAFPIYIYKGLYFFAFLFLIYLILSIYGYSQWKKNLNN